MDCNSVVECLPTMGNILGSISALQELTEKKKKNLFWVNHLGLESVSLGTRATLLLDREVGACAFTLPHL